MCHTTVSSYQFIIGENMALDCWLQSGRAGCSKLEKFADAVLCIPGVVWGGRKITLDLQQEQYNAVSDLAISWLNARPEVPDALGLVVGGWGIVFIAFSIVALPFLAVGLIFKKIALMRDDSAQRYHQLLGHALVETKLGERIKGLHTMVESCTQSIKQAKTDVAAQSGNTSQHAARAHRQALQRQGNFDLRLVVLADDIKGSQQQRDATLQLANALFAELRSGPV